MTDHDWPALERAVAEKLEPMSTPKEPSSARDDFLHAGKFSDRGLWAYVVRRLGFSGAYYETESYWRPRPTSSDPAASHALIDAMRAEGLSLHYDNEFGEHCAMFSPDRKDSDCYHIEVGSGCGDTFFRSVLLAAARALGVTP